MGEMLDAPVDAHQNGWGAARILDYTLAQVAQFTLQQENRWLPTKSQPPLVSPVAHLNQVRLRGLDSQMFISPAHKGPFTMKTPVAIKASYPALWNHNADQETRLVCMPDSQLSSSTPTEWKKKLTSSGLLPADVHLNRDFTFGSQALAISFH